MERSGLRARMVLREWPAHRVLMALSVQMDWLARPV
jgi:hypothetical protein